MPAGDGPFPVVLLLHAGASSKETWWDENGYERGPGLTRQLLESGYAVFALDAEHHGERMSSIDFVPIQTWYFQNEWWAVFRHMVTETAADYRRALDYLATRDQLEVSRVAAVGQSMGGVTSLILAAADPRVKTVMAGSAALAPDWLYPVAPINVASGLTDSAILLIEADEDVLVEAGWTEALHSSIPATPKRMVTLASGHRLPEEYIGLTVEWVREHLVR